MSLGHSTGWLKITQVVTSILLSRRPPVAIKVVRRSRQQGIDILATPPPQLSHAIHSNRLNNDRRWRYIYGEDDCFG